MIDHARLFYELNKKLNEQGYTIAASTVRKYVYKELADGPIVDGLGKGKGTKSNYCPAALGELYAAWMLLNGPIQTSLERLKKIRLIAIELRDNSEIEIDSKMVSELKVTWRDLAYLLELYLNYCEEMNLLGSTKFRVEMEAIEDGKRRYYLIAKKVRRIKQRLLKG